VGERADVGLDDDSPAHWRALDATRSGVAVRATIAWSGLLSGTIPTSGTF
jgi:hypothetical protein